MLSAFVVDTEPLRRPRLSDVLLEAILRGILRSRSRGSLSTSVVDTGIPSDYLECQTSPLSDALREGSAVHSAPIYRRVVRENRAPRAAAVMERRRD